MADKIDKNYEVLDGPSREDLFDSLRLRGEWRLVRFDYIFNAEPWDDERKHENDQRKSVFVKVYRITAPMGECDPNTWMVEGMSIVGQNTEDEPVMTIFSTQRRTGRIIFNYDAPMTPGEADGIIHAANPPEQPPPDEDEGNDNPPARN